MMPGEVKTRFRTFEINQKSVWKPFAGENIAANTVAVSLRQIRRGCVFYETKYKPKEVHTFVAEIVVLTIPNVIKNGFCPVIHVHTAHVACRFKKILALIDGKTKQ
jgi:elongation factor 1-alpha